MHFKRNYTPWVLMQKWQLMLLFFCVCFFLLFCHKMLLSLFQEVLGSQTSPEPMEEDGILTPPLSPPTSPSRHTLYDATILNIPPPLSPLTDDEDFMLTPPRTPSRQGTRTDRQRPTRNLSSLFSAMQRDL